MHRVDEDIDNVDHGDIFRALDTDLVEVFNRRQLADLFADIPLGEQNERLDRINELLSSRNIDEFLSKRREREASGNYISCLWKFGILPLPIFNYRRAWRRLGPNNIRGFLVKLITIFVTNLMRIIRFSLFIIASSAYLHNILRNLFIFSNLITFSNNFLRDIVTFIFRNNTGLLDRHKTIIMHNGNIFYFNEDDNYNAYSIWRVGTTTAYNWISSLIRMTCINGVIDAECAVYEDSLIFKFSRVMNEFFPAMANSESNFSWSLTIYTVILYLFYALGGDLVCLNVLFFWSINVGKRILHYKDIYAGLGRIVWNALHRNIV